MSDHGAATPREEPHDAAHDAVRDALPALLHGRVSASQRAALEGHLAACHRCEAEFRTLAAVRDLYTAPVRHVSVDRIAAMVRARTVVAGANPSDGVPPVAPAPTLVRAGAVPTRRAPAWARRGAVRAFAASALLAIGSGGLLLHRTASAPAPGAAARTRADAPVLAPRAATPRDPSGSLLGASFSDLSDTELAAVVAAVDDPASATPAAEPTPVAPTVLESGGE